MALATSSSTLLVRERPFDWESIAAEIEGTLRRFFGGQAPRSEALELKAELQRISKLDADIGEDSEAMSQHRASLDTEKIHMAGSFGTFERLFQQIREAKLHGGRLPDVDFDRLATEMNPLYGYSTPRSSFHPTRYMTFEDWFLRELADAVRSQCLARALEAQVSAPVQGRILQRPLGAGIGGQLTLKVSVITADALLGLVDGHQLIQFGLRKVDYHRVHCPVDGIIERFSACPKDELFPGSEAMTIFEIRCVFGTVKLICIGEWSVQSFVTHAAFTHPGKEVHKMDELGHFDFGSQVLLVLPASIRLLKHGGDRVFPGDLIGQLHGRTGCSLG